MAALIFIFLEIFLILWVFYKPRSLFLFATLGYIFFFGEFIELRVFTIGGVNIFPVDILLIVFIFYILVHCLISPKTFLFLFSDWPSLLFGLLLVIGIVDVARGLSLYGKSAIGETRHYIAPIAFFYFVRLVFIKKEHLTSYLKWAAIMMIVLPFFKFFLFYILGYHGALETLSGNDVLYLQGTYRFMGANDAISFSFPFLGVYFLNLLRRKEQNARNLAILILSVTVLLVLQHRSVWVAVFSAVILAHWITKRFFSSRQVLFAFAGLAIISAVVLPLLLLSNNKIFVSLQNSLIFIQNYKLDTTASFRLNAWSQEFNLIKKNPIIGRGFGGYTQFFDPSGNVLYELPIHSGYISFLSKMGAIGLTVFLSGITAWYVLIRKRIRIIELPEQSAMLWIYILCIVNIVIFGFFYDFPIALWVITGLAVNHSNMLMGQGSNEI